MFQTARLNPYTREQTFGASDRQSTGCAIYALLVSPILYIENIESISRLPFYHQAPAAVPLSVLGHILIRQDMLEDVLLLMISVQTPRLS
jgi:hypothetical protein